jgi:RNA polymerase sigma factor (sigma-70 family)
VTEKATVFIIDDDATASASVAALVESMGLAYERFDSAESFLAASIPTTTPACVVTDLRMVGMSGIELQSKLRDAGITIPLVMITAYATTHAAVQSMKLGAVTVLDKGCSEQELWDGIAAGLRESRENISRQMSLGEVRERIAQLNDDEEKVLDLISHGKANKQVAAELGISIRTVEQRRRRIMQKLRVNTFADLMRLVTYVEHVDSPAAVGDWSPQEQGDCDSPAD